MTPEEIRAVDEATQRAYQLVFSSPDGKRVLTDLSAYCHARRTTFDESDVRHVRPHRFLPTIVFAALTISIWPVAR